MVILLHFGNMRCIGLCKECTLSVGAEVPRAVVDAVRIPNGFPKLYSIINLFASRWDSNVSQHPDTLAIPRIELDAVIDADSVDIRVRNHLLDSRITKKQTPLRLTFEITHIAHGAIRFACTIWERIQ